MSKPRIVVIGGGPGGYAAGEEAAKQGAHVTLIEKDRLGGTCLNRGCIPTKALLRTAHVMQDIKHARDFGLTATQTPSIDITALRTRKETIVNTLVGQLEMGAKRAKIEVITGEGSLLNQRTVRINETDGTSQDIEADAIIIATGSTPQRLPFIDHELECVWTSDEALELTSIPASIIIIGGGVIGVEFATAYAAFGVDVTIIEIADQLIPTNDKRAARTLATALKSQGVAILTKTSVTAVEQTSSGLAEVTLSDGRTLQAEIVLSAVGRVANTEGLNASGVGIELDRNAITVNEYFETSTPGIYAIGDVNAAMMLAHVAEAQGEAAARNALAQIAGQEQTHTVDLLHIPACIYTTPEVASIGHTASSAQTSGITAVNRIAKFAGNGKAQAEGETEGYVSLIATQDAGTIIGASIVGPHSVELIAQIGTLMSAEATVADVVDTVYAHPTVAEVIKAAAKIT